MEILKRSDIILRDDIMGILDTIVKTTKHRIKNLESVNYKKLNLKKKKRSLSEAIIKCGKT